MSFKGITGLIIALSVILFVASVVITVAVVTGIGDDVLDSTLFDVAVAMMGAARVVVLIVLIVLLVKFRNRIKGHGTVLSIVLCFIGLATILSLVASTSLVRIVRVVVEVLYLLVAFIVYRIRVKYAHEAQEVYAVFGEAREMMMVAPAPGTSETRGAEAVTIGSPASRSRHGHESRTPSDRPSGTPAAGGEPSATPRSAEAPATPWSAEPAVRGSVTLVAESKPSDPIVSPPQGSGSGPPSTPSRPLAHSPAPPVAAPH